ncbi:MAG: hybrid sensor histidine kinase/response regulator [Bacteroidetes bacterium]|nr:hybrid sensor histidine kinase/response regulator [Bacteroidota bacterium]
MDKSTKILVVEDDFQNRQLITVYLSRAYDVQTAVNGLDALEKLKTYQPDLIVSDISMPHLDGFGLYDKMKADFPQLRSIPFIFLTAHSDSEKRKHSKEIGSDDFLTKPIEQEELLASIRGKLKRVREIRSTTQAELMDDVDRLKRDILTTITHEVNTPLFIIKLTANLLLDETMEFRPGELQELLLRIKRSGDRLDTLLNDFLVTARIASGEAEREHRELSQDIDIGFILEHMMPAFRKEAVAGNITINSKLPRGLPSFRGHIDQIVDVVSRMVNNSVKFTESGGTIDIIASNMNDDILVEVRDTGIGIPQDSLSKVFDKFYQINRAEIEQQGAGLGLFIAQELARINGGKIEVESTEGHGSMFRLRLPIRP